MQGILAEILEFVMGKGLIPADQEIWRVRRRAIVPALHQKVSISSFFFTGSTFMLFAFPFDPLFVVVFPFTLYGKKKK